MSAQLSQSPLASPLSAADIDEAAQRISGVVFRSPLQVSERLSEVTGATVNAGGRLVVGLGLSHRAAVEGTYGLSYERPARHMRVSEVRPGMKGYGLSVFYGTKIEKFDVEVVSILKNFNPKCDVVLITCKGDYPLCRRIRINR